MMNDHVNPDISGQSFATQALFKTIRMKFCILELVRKTTKCFSQIYRKHTKIFSFINCWFPFFKHELETILCAHSLFENHNVILGRKFP